MKITPLATASQTPARAARSLAAAGGRYSLLATRYSLLLLAFSLQAPGLFAQSAGPAPAPVDDEIIVLDAFNVTDSSRTNEWIATQSLTGSRMAERAIDLPYQMQIITDEFLKDFNLISVVDQLGTVSGLVLEADQSDPVAAASRGVGGNTDSKLRGFPILITRDGFKHAQPPTGSNTQQVEVIKGPISVFYGNMQPGGIINYISRRPSQRFEARGRLSGGSYDYWEAETSINIPIVPKRVFLLASYNEMHRKSDIQYVNTKNTTAFASLLVKPFKWTSLTATIERQKYSGNRGAGINRYVNTRLVDSPLAPTAWDQNSGIDTGLYWDWARAGLNANGPDYWINRLYDRFHVQLEQRLSQNWTFKAGFQWQRKQTDINGWVLTGISVANDAPPGTPLSIVRHVPEVTFQDWRWPYNFIADLKGDFKTGGIKHTLLFSADIGRMVYDTPVWRNRNPNSSHPDYQAYINMLYWTPWDPDFVWDTSWFSWDTMRSGDRVAADLNSRTIQRQKLSGFSASEVMRLFNNRLILRGSLRYDETHQARFLSASRTTGTDRTTGASLPYPLYPWESWQHTNGGWANNNDYGISWSVGANWRVLKDDNLLAFANYGTSFSAPMQADSGNDSLLPNETGKGFEAGLKSSALSGKLTSVISYFWIEKYDIAQPVLNDPGAGSGLARYALGDERSLGVDMDLNYNITPNLTLIASAAHLKTKVLKSTDPWNVGKRKTAVPDTTFSASAKYKFTGFLRGFETGATVRYQSNWTRAHYKAPTPTTAEQLEEIIGGTTIWRAFLKYRWTTGNSTTHTLQLNASNLFDKFYTGFGSTPSLGLQVNLTYTISFR